jgi:septum formation protein
MLEALGVEFRVVVPSVLEMHDGDPAELVIANARRKAEAGLLDAVEGEIALGVDTDVVLDRELLGKAADAAGARAHLESLSGRTHEVLSGLVLLGPQQSGAEPTERTGLARSEVRFRELDPATLDLYLDSGEWLDRAGSYAIQGLGSILVERLAGDFSNVVGLPIGLLLELAPELAGSVG